MSIAVAPTYLNFRQIQKGPYIRKALLVVTGLTGAAANTIPHGLPKIPQTVVYVATNGVPGFETATADATNLYYTTGAAQTALKAIVEY